MGLFLAFFLQLAAEVAIILLIRTVEFQDRRGFLREVRRAVVDLVGHISLEILAGQLDRFGLAWLGTAARFGRLHRSPPAASRIAAALLTITRRAEKQPIEC